MTDKVLEKLAPPEGGRLDVFDALLPGFGVRVSKTGGRTFFLFYRHGGKQRRATLGKYPVMKLAEARAAARPLIEIAKAGGDPGALLPNEDQTAAVVAPAPSVLTFREMKEDFILRYAKPQNRAWHEVERIFDRYVIPLWGHRPAAEIKRQDIIQLLDDLVDRGVPVMAKQTHAAIRRLFNWAADRDLVDGSPCVR
ncbi:MAG TPA: integrase arm-type DNA-binding domain-containing protein, partial [Aliidongia sp.]|uniref:tyrosine-type recombinase/integrase n=1 Tax=Aliidongia sp. TaxID=1914230 RepID=UPI002DDD9D2E